MSMEPTRIKVFRFNPKKDEEPTFSTYEVFQEEPRTVLSLINYVYENMDRTLAFRNFNCYRGICMACLLKVNGRKVRGCTELIRPGESVTLEPAPGAPIIRDLVVDFGARGGPH